MMEGRLKIYEAADKIMEFLVKNGAVSEGKRLTYREVFAASGLGAEVFSEACEHLQNLGYLASNNDGEMWAPNKNKNFEYFFMIRQRVLRAESETMLQNYRSYMQQHNFLAPHSGNINIYGNAQIQQATVNSSQTGSFTGLPLDELRNLLGEIQDGLSELDNAHQKGQAESAITEIETELRSSQPNQGAIKRRLESLRRIVEGAAIGLLSSNLANLAMMIGQFIAEHMPEV